MQGGCCGLCDMGACNSSFLGFLSGVFVLPAYAAGLDLNLHHHAVASMHENYEANKIGQEKEAKDASSIVYVESKYGRRFFLLSHPVIQLGGKTHSMNWSITNRLIEYIHQARVGYGLT